MLNWFKLKDFGESFLRFEFKKVVWNWVCFLWMIGFDASGYGGGGLKGVWKGVIGATGVEEVCGKMGFIFFY